MSAFTRKFVSAAALSCLALVLGASPALATPVHHHKHHHVTKHAVVKSSGSAIIRIAQKHLYNLGYYMGSIDGKMGPKTRAAIKKFQFDKRLKPDGVLGPKTRAALEAADPTVTSMTVAPQPVAVDPNAVINPDYTTNLTGGTKALQSRFARVDVTETGTGSDKTYAVSLNGQSILTADGQPSVIGMSQTFTVGDRDEIVFTSFSPSDTGCMYRTHVLVMGNSDSKVLDVGNCTREFQASAHDGSLYITFPEHDDARAIGSVWRIEGENVTRL